MQPGISDTFACKHNTNASGISSENHTFGYRFLLHVNRSPVFLMVLCSKIKTKTFNEFKVLELVKSRGFIFSLLEKQMKGYTVFSVIQNVTSVFININNICIGDELSLTAAICHRVIDIKGVKDPHINSSSCAKPYISKLLFSFVEFNSVLFLFFFLNYLKPKKR